MRHATVKVEDTALSAKVCLTLLFLYSQPVVEPSKESATVCIFTVEPPINGHVGDEHFVHIVQGLPLTQR